MKTLVLKIDVDTYRGTRQGVMPLVELLKKHEAQATFLWSLGQDHTGWALRRIFRRGFFKKVRRTSVVSNYGLRTLMYGILLPGPDIGRSCAEKMRQVAAAGFEMGIHAYDHVYWQDSVYRKDSTWTLKEMDKAREAFKKVFVVEAKTHGAAGWQMNDTAFNWVERFEYASDTRGTSPFFPMLASGRKGDCLQLPTTLPTMDELLGVDGIDENNVHEALLQRTASASEWGHVYTLHAELEGMRLLGAFEKFLIGLKSQGYELLSMKSYAEKLKAQPEKSRSPNWSIGKFQGAPGDFMFKANR